MKLRYILTALTTWLLFGAAQLQANNRDSHIVTASRDSIENLQDSVDIQLSIYELNSYLKYDKKRRKERAIEEIDNDIEKNIQPFEDKERHMLLEKGASFAGASFGFTSRDIEESLYEPVAKVDMLYYRSLTTSVTGGHFIANNIALYGGFSYNFTDIRLDVEADILDVLIGATKYKHLYASTKYCGVAGVKNFIPLSRSQRMFITTQTALTYIYTSAITKSFYDEGADAAKVTKHNHEVGVGLSPGFLYFVTHGLAFEFTLNPIRASWERSERVNNDTNRVSSDNYGVSFRFMPFNMSMGLTYYFGLDYNKHRNYLKKINQY